MNKTQLKEILQNLKIRENYSWELYLFNIDNRATGSPYKITKINFKNSEDILTYGQNLVSCVEEFQLDKVSEIEEYCGENPKISCDQLDLEKEIINEYWRFFENSLDNAVVNSSENIRVKGYVICAKPKLEGLKKFIFVKKANPIVQGDRGKSKTFKMNDDETLNSFNDKIFKFYLSIDFFIVDNNLYTFNLSFQEIFKIEKTLKILKNNAIEEILKKTYFNNENNKFREELNKKISSQMYSNFNVDKLIELDDIKMRKNVAQTLKITLNEHGIFEFENLDKIKSLIKYFNNRIIQEKRTSKVYEVSGNIKERG